VIGALLTQVHLGSPRSATSPDSAAAAPSPTVIATPLTQVHLGASPLTQVQLVGASHHASLTPQLPPASQSSQLGDSPLTPRAAAALASTTAVAGEQSEPAALPLATCHPQQGPSHGLIAEGFPTDSAAFSAATDSRSDSVEAAADSEVADLVTAAAAHSASVHPLLSSPPLPPPSPSPSPPPSPSPSPSPPPSPSRPPSPPPQVKVALGPNQPPASREYPTET